MTTSMVVSTSILRNSPLSMPRRRGVYDQGAAPVDDVLVVEAREVGKVARFGNHQFWDAGICGLADLGRPDGEQYLHQVEVAAAVLGGYGLVFDDDRDDAFLDHCLEERFLVLVIEIERCPWPRRRREATSSRRVAAKPFSTKSSSAAASSSEGRASLRRLRRGGADDIGNLMTLWSLSCRSVSTQVNGLP